MWEQTFNMHLAAGQQITLTMPPHPKYGTGGEGAVVNGVLGSSERYGDAEWLGFAGDDFIATIEFAETQTPKAVKLRFFKGEGQWIYLPTTVEILAENNDESFQSVATLNDIETDTKIAEVTLPLTDVTTKTLRVVVKNFGIIPEDRQGGGNAAWLFVDEVVVN